MAKIKRIGVLTSGGDGPGLNPCIRAVTRTALSKGVEVMGIRRGYRGLVNGEMEPLDARSVGGILARAGRSWAPRGCPNSKSCACSARRSA